MVEQQAVCGMRTVGRWTGSAWVPDTFQNLKVGDVFRLFEPDGTPVGDGAPWRATSDAEPDTTTVPGVACNYGVRCEPAVDFDEVAPGRWVPRRVRVLRAATAAEVAEDERRTPAPAPAPVDVPLEPVLVHGMFDTAAADAPDLSVRQFTKPLFADGGKDVGAEEYLLVHGRLDAGYSARAVLADGAMGPDAERARAVVRSVALDLLVALGERPEDLCGLTSAPTTAPTDIGYDEDGPF